jgi:hypothetical protein
MENGKGKGKWKRKGKNGKGTSYLIPNQIKDWDDHQFRPVMGTNG